VFKYSKKLLDHFKNPHNYGSMKDPDGVGREGNPVCGDVIELHIKVRDNKIEDIKFLTFGCVAAVGTSSVLTEMVKGKTLKEGKRITSQELAKEIGGLPSVKFHCSILGIKALRAAIKDYEDRQSAIR